MILPLLTEFEEERVLVNLEHRVQKTNKTFSSFFEGRSIINVLSAGFQIDKHLRKSEYLGFVEEILETPEIFDGFNRRFIFLTGRYLYNTNSACFVRKSINKLAVEDFYLTNKSTKNSVTMNSSSKVYQYSSSNFPIFS